MLRAAAVVEELQAEVLLAKADSDMYVATFTPLAHV